MKLPWVIRIWVENCYWLLKGCFNAKTEAKALVLRRKQEVEEESSPQNQDPWGRGLYLQRSLKNLRNGAWKNKTFFCFPELWRKYVHENFKKDFIYFQRKGREGRKERGNINVQLPLQCPLLGTWPATQACVLTGNQTSNPLFHRTVFNSLSHTSQGCDHEIFEGTIWKIT